MRIGKLQRRWTSERPVLFDKETRTVNLLIEEESITKQAEGEGEEAENLSGYGYYPVQIDCTNKIYLCDVKLKMCDYGIT